MQTTTSGSDLPLGPGVELVTSNQHGLVALEKPAGLISHPNEPGKTDRCLLKADYYYEEEKFSWKAGKTEHHAWLLNRLDSPTSGIVLLALNETIRAIVKQLFAAHKVKKTYYALVRRAPLPPSGSWKDTLKKVPYRKVKRSKAEQTICAETHYKVIKKSAGRLPIVLLKLMPITGRTHQLRIQCQQHRHPIIGDRTYGDFTFNREIAAATGEKRMMLHSAETTFRYIFHGKEYDFHTHSELPTAFTKLMDSNLRIKSC